MSEPTVLVDRITRALVNARAPNVPFRHWLLEHVLPRHVAEELSELPIDLPALAHEVGRREAHNSTRVFFSAANRQRFPVAESVAEAFQCEWTAHVIGAICGTYLSGSYLRIEYCQDTDGFWLEPHTDIAAKLFTMVLYLSPGAEAASCGTDIYDSAMTRVGGAPGTFNSALVFIPGSNTWHGFARRPIRGVRRSLIVNFVKAEWRARHELAFPDRPVR
jgi:hypothetical protein